jgi:Flp pilus assembly protein TadG
MQIDMATPKRLSSAAGLPRDPALHLGTSMRYGRATIRLPAADFNGTDSGATTVEFAMVGSTFCMLFLLAALFSVYYLRVTILDLTVQKVSRQLLLNQTLTQSQFAAAVQSGSFGMLSGQTINVAVQSASSFGAITPVANINGGGTLPYNTGSTGSDVLVQVGYTDSSLGLFLPNFLTSVASTIAFQREPSGQ